jgi:hypothetical protein
VAALALVPAASVAPRAEALCSVSLLTPCLQMSLPGALSLGTVNAGTTTTSPEQGVVVSSNLQYGVKVSADLVDGRMKQWTGAAYAASPRILANPLRVARSSYNGTPVTPSFFALSGTPTLLGTGLGPTDCLVGLLCGSHTLGVQFRLSTSFSDRRVSPDSYRILVTYTADHAF